MCEDCDYGPPDLPAIPPGAFSDLVKIADAWVKSIHDSIDHLKNEHDELRKEMSKEIRVKMGELQHAHLSFEAALDTFRAIEEKRTGQLISEAVRRVLAERNEHE